MTDHRFRFDGHAPTSQHLPAEQDHTFIDGVGRWERGDVHAVTEDVAHFLRMTQVFTELAADDVTPESLRFWQREPATAEPALTAPTALAASESVTTTPAPAATSTPPTSKEK